MNDAERDASAKPQGQALPPAVVETPAAWLARLAMSLRVRQAEQIHERRSYA